MLLGATSGLNKDRDERTSESELLHSGQNGNKGKRIGSSIRYRNLRTPSVDSELLTRHAFGVERGNPLFSPCKWQEWS